MWFGIKANNCLHRGTAYILCQRPEFSGLWHFLEELLISQYIQRGHESHHQACCKIQPARINSCCTSGCKEIPLNPSISMPLWAERSWPFLHLHLLPV